MKNLLKVAAVAGVLLLPMSEAQAQTRVSPFLAFHDDFDLGVGAAVAFPLAEVHENLSAVGSFAFFFPGDGSGFGVDVDYLEFNADVMYQIPMDGASVVPWLLAGLNIARISASVDISGVGSASNSNTEIGLNAGGGITFPRESVSPFAGAKIELGGGEGFVLFGGLSFPIGG